jgi:hypothetical protein
VRRGHFAGWLCAAVLMALPAASRGQSSTADDRISISADGATLTGTNGGGGGALGWLHNFDAGTLVGVAAEHQALANAQWTFGSINGSLTRGPDNQRYSFYGEVHEGAGDDGLRAFHYAIETAGVYGTYFHALSLQLEDRRIDVETTHGNLPKAGVAYLWNPHWLTSASYSYSTNGDLGTRLTALRVDHYGAAINLLAGVSFGQASPVVFGNVASIVSPARQLKEGYVGFSMPVPQWRGQFILVGDYQDISGSKHAIVTLTYIFHVGATDSARR